jgi:hypothetical protein
MSSPTNSTTTLKSPNTNSGGAPIPPQQSSTIESAANAATLNGIGWNPTNGLMAANAAYLAAGHAGSTMPGWPATANDFQSVFSLINFNFYSLIFSLIVNGNGRMAAQRLINDFTVSISEKIVQI